MYAKRAEVIEGGCFIVVLGGEVRSVWLVGGDGWGCVDEGGSHEDELNDAKGVHFVDERDFGWSESV